MITKIENSGIAGTQQASWSRRILFSQFFGSAITGTEEQDIMAAPTGNALIDGNYTQGLYGIPPVIRANLLDQRSMWLRSHLMLGINFVNISSYLILREYWGASLIRELQVEASSYPEDPSGQNLCLEVISRYNVTEATGQPRPLRVHNEWYSSTGGGVGFLRTTESFINYDYPLLTTNIDNPIRLTAQWSQAGSMLYTDSYEIEA